MCAPVVGTILVYSDRHYLAWYYALTTAPYLEERLLKAGEILAARTGSQDVRDRTMGPRHRCGGRLVIWLGGFFATPGQRCYSARPSCP